MEVTFKFSTQKDADHLRRLLGTAYVRGDHGSYDEARASELIRQFEAQVESKFNYRREATKA